MNRVKENEEMNPRDSTTLPTHPKVNVGDSRCVECRKNGPKFARALAQLYFLSPQLA